ncbi:adenylate/guanylate cyclase domain-containing protein [Mesorhizobium sp.]|uniref:adenylate/guanylate cyclase domain-containing protein n=1 Tax=Mesorhizobium sp. TaxID=1871066 RepID=UPI00257B3354|nr:adenylate/guanylate cyclase domain-containing protein [Mesorhizobium sp.]
MTYERIQRRLAAVMAADVVGYSRLMETDEAGTLAALKSRRKQVLQPLVARHHGRVFKVTGDGVMVEFASAVNALQCAIDVQHAMAAANAALPEKLRIALRIGVNLGDVMVEGSDLYGDGVNIAARLETTAEPGGILISGTIYDHVRNKIEVGFEDLGAQTVKNIALPVRIYRVSGTPPVVISTSKAITDKPSIAVLPFTNMSSDPEQEYFADGLAEDLITDLSKVPGLLVIARNSTFAYKGRSVDVRSVARDLRVHYVLEGSVRREKARVRINAQLIDATDSSHLWADRFDRDLADVFLLQDEVVGTIVNALSDVLPAAATSSTRRAASLEAYDLFVRGRVLVIQSPESNRAAPPLLERAIELDPGFADAHAWLAMSHHFAWAYWLDAPERHHSLALAAARRAVSLDPENAVAHAIFGDVLIYDGKPDEGAAELATALRVNPNHADAGHSWGNCRHSRERLSRASDICATPFASIRTRRGGTIGFSGSPNTQRVNTPMPSRHSGMRPRTGSARNASWLQVWRGSGIWKRPGRKQGNSSPRIRISQYSTGQAHNRSGTRPIDNISSMAMKTPACHSRAGRGHNPIRANLDI